MKVKNIVFSGFAAVILMGTANATTPFKIASQAYVDTEISKLSGSNGAISQLEEKIAGTNETLSNSFESGTTVVGAINDLKSDVDTLTGNASTSGSVAHAEASAASAASAAADAQGDVDALEAVVGNLTAQEGGLTGFASGTDTVVEALNELNAGKANADVLGGNFTSSATVQDALDAKVNVNDKATTIRTVNGGASDDKWATEKAVATIVEGLTGGGGTVSQQIADALGDLGTGNTTVEDALATKQAAITQNAKLSADLVDDSNATNKFVTASDKTTWNGKQDALTQNQLDALTAAANLLAAGYTTCINQQGGSGHCVLSASSTGLEWIDVTSPFEIE